MSNPLCQHCQSEVAKDERQFVDDDTFAFLSEPPVALGIFCSTCFDAQVRPALDEYNSQVKQAENVNIFYSTQSKESRFIRRFEKPVQVENCPDREETILRLAFLAVKAGRNTLLDVTVESSKVHKGGTYKTSKWKGRGVPASVSDDVLTRRFPGTPN